VFKETIAGPLLPWEREFDRTLSIAAQAHAMRLAKNFGGRTSSRFGPGFVTCGSAQNKTLQLQREAMARIMRNIE
jgi:hypothetical protein